MSRHIKLSFICSLIAILGISCEIEVDKLPNSASFVKIYPDIDSGHITDVITTKTGDIIITGFDVTTNVYSILVKKISSKGNPIWDYAERLDIKEAIGPFTIRELASGNFIIVNRHEDIIRILGANGQLMHKTELYPTFGMEYVSRPIIGSDGKIYISFTLTGRSEHACIATDEALNWELVTALESNTGNIGSLWFLNIVKADLDELWYCAADRSPGPSQQTAYHYDRKSEQIDWHTRFIPPRTSLRHRDDALTEYGSAVAINNHIFSVGRPRSNSDLVNGLYYGRSYGFYLHRLDLDFTKKDLYIIEEKGVGLLPLDLEIGLNGELLVLGTYTKASEVGNFVFELSQDGGIIRKLFYPSPVTVYSSIWPAKDGGYCLGGFTSSGSGSDFGAISIGSQWVLSKTDVNFKLPLKQ
jgi:hypothetical protein